MDASLRLTRPADWPPPKASSDSVDAAIELGRHDLPHRSSLTEWWYVNAHVGTADGRKLSLFAAFFRIAKGQDEVTRETLYAHSLTWALSDVDGRRYLSDTVVDKDAPRLGLERLARAEASGNKGAAKDPRVRRALREMLERGQVPYPDHMFETDPYVAERRLALDYDGNCFEKLDNGDYKLSLWHRYHEVGVELVLTPQKAPVRHGDDGVVRGPDGADMFYYFIPRLAVAGHVTMNAVAVPVTSGSAWYDHEFGGQHAPTSAEGAAEDLQKRADAGVSAAEQVAWSWAAVQLDDGTELTAYDMVDLADGKHLGKRLVHIDAEGRRREWLDAELLPIGEWRSTRSFNSYPTRWRLVSREAGLELDLNASFDDQELVTLISKPAFWEGRVEAEGRFGPATVRGVGYVERSGHLAVEDLEGFFKAVGKEVRKSVANLLPYEPTHDQVRDLIASEARGHYMEGVDVRQFVKTGVAPVREITDRGGKGWRSYAALACCDVVGGDSRDFVHWLAMPELMHVGSLIVDDVQDRSTVRRGGPACHVTHGEALAINAGTSCYFMGQHLLHGTQVSTAQKLELYDLYFEALRAGHAGQAADIEGLWSYIPRAVETGDITELESRVLAIHRLKTAAPAGALARMGALVGGGTRAQIEGLGRYFESLGLAFQMVDDVLNLRGFAGELKMRGEDLAHGKVTLPVVKALGRLGHDERRHLADAIQKKPETQPEVDALIAIIESTGGLSATSQQARDLVESAWNAVEVMLEPSIVKLMLRSFGWFVLERHY
ncbi:MAG: polyprenyl synthetase family protein [Deltaproteobacteria bacterium]|nr:polyprenyl synthetase family protein [Deltaproteobacteria bacterium]